MTVSPYIDIVPYIMANMLANNCLFTNTSKQFAFGLHLESCFWPRECKSSIHSLFTKVLVFSSTWTKCLRLAAKIDVWLLLAQVTLAANFVPHLALGGQCTAGLSEAFAENSSIVLEEICVRAVRPNNTIIVSA